MKASERHRLKHDKAADALAMGVEWVRERKTSLLISLVIVLFVCACIIWLTLTKQGDESIAAALLSDADAEAQIVTYLGRGTDAKKVGEIVAAYEMIAQNHPKSKRARLAVFNAAQVLMQAGRADEASASFRRVLSMAPNEKGLVMMARRGLAESLEESGKIEEAITNYSALLEVVDGDAKAQAYWDIGRCYAELGQTEKATESLKKVVTDSPDSAWAKLAQSGIDGSQALAYVPSEASSVDPVQQPGGVVEPGFNVSAMPPLPADTVPGTEDVTPSTEDETPASEDNAPPAEE